MPTYRAYGLSIRSEVPLPSLRSESSRDATDVTIETSSLPADGAAPPDHSGDWHRLSPQDSTIVRAGVGALRVRDGRSITVTPSGVDVEPSQDLAQFIAGPAMGLLLQQRGFFCLHASCVAQPATMAGIAFAGDSGVGKSTLARLMVEFGYRFVTDDIAAIDPTATEPMVTPGPVATREVVPDNRPIGPGDRPEKRVARVPAESCADSPVRLRHVYVLSPTGSVEPTPLRGLTAGVALLRHSYFPELLSGVSGPESLMQSCVALARSVRVSRMARPGNLDQLRTAAERLAGTEARATPRADS